jgi:hypothetical protein
MTICEANECSKQAYFNTEGLSKGRFCSAHKSGDMVNVKDKRCNNAECKQRPSFNILGSKPLYCGEHQLTGMVNVMTKFCETHGCLITPVYNAPDKKTGRFCATHKSEGMINVVNKMCEENGCNSARSFGIAGSHAQYCAEHKKSGMVDVKHKRCLYTGCDLTPSYGVTGEVPTYCSNHKLDGMTNVKHKKCQHVGCQQIPSYNVINETIAIYCKDHKLDEMVDVAHAKCMIKGCIIRPLYNLITEKKPKYCYTHKTVDMIDVVNPTCKSSWCLTQIRTGKNDGYCLFCYINLFPDKPVSRNYKTKEKSVSDTVLSTFTNMSWISDKKVNDGCSRRRPDLLLDMGSHIIIVEIDENQHVGYNCSCENKRLMEISQDVGHRNIVFIRFNPDEYIDKTGIKIKSCWTISKTGISNVNKNNNKEWNTRLSMLTNQIQYWIDNKPEKMIEIIELYYDNFE